MTALDSSPNRGSGRCCFQSHPYRSSVCRKVLAPADCRLEPTESPPCFCWILNCFGRGDRRYLLRARTWIRVFSTFCCLLLRDQESQIGRSCRQNLIEIMKLLIDIVRIRNCARHFHPQRFAITLTQTPKPGTQRRYGDSKFLRCFFLIWRRPSTAVNERP